LPASVSVTLDDVPGIVGVTVRQIDSATPLATGPDLRTMQGANSVTVDFSGYGLALIEFVTGPAPTASP